MVNSQDGIPKTAGNAIIPELIAAGASYDGEFFIWPNGWKTRPYKNRFGYHKISKNLGNKQFVTFSLARFVCWLTYGPPPAEKPWVDHINRTRHDDRPENLRWTNAKENARNVSPETWAARVKRFVEIGKINHGEKNPRAKLTLEKVSEMRRLYATGGHSHADLKNLYQVSQTTVSRVLNYEYWRGAETPERAWVKVGRNRVPKASLLSPELVAEKTPL